MAANMFRHNIGPNGEVRGMRNLLGQQVRGDPIVMNTPLPISLSGEFLLFLHDNKLPNGRANPLPKLTSEEVLLFGKPYREWAPAPFNNTRTPKDSATNFFMFAFSGMEDLLDISAMLSGRFQGLSLTEYELAFNKQRAWGGLVPLSDRRWKEKGLDQLDDSLLPKNFVKAMDHLEKADVFMCFQIPEELGKMRKAHNRVYDHLAHFDQVLASYYAQRQHETRDPSSQGKAAELWAEFFFSRIEFMTARVRQWYMSHANALQARLVEELQTRARQGGEIFDTDLKKLTMLQGHRSTAEITFLIPLTGFKNPLAHWKHLSSPPIVNWTHHLEAGGRLALPAGAYPQDVVQRERVFVNRHQYLASLDPDEAGRQGSSPRDRVRRKISTWAATDQAASELRGTPTPVTITEELWITRLKARLTPSPDNLQAVNYTHWGFVAYRIDYSHTDTEWETFVSKFNSDVLSSWTSPEGGNVLGADDSIKQSCKITWLDGREHGNPPNDIPAARRHFASLVANKSPLVSSLVFPHGKFLVADHAAISSYINPPTLPGQELVDAADLKPHIVVVQGQDFDPAHAARDKEAPGYNGQVLVAGCALFEDVFPALFMTLYPLKYIWNISASHPGGVYLGAPLGHYQRMMWAQFNLLRVELMQSASVQAASAQSQAAGPGG